MPRKEDIVAHKNIWMNYRKFVEISYVIFANNCIIYELLLTFTVFPNQLHY